MKNYTLSTKQIHYRRNFGSSKRLPDGLLSLLPTKTFRHPSVVFGGEKTRAESKCIFIYKQKVVGGFSPLGKKSQNGSFQQIGVDGVWYPDGEVDRWIRGSIEVEKGWYDILRLLRYIIHDVSLGRRFQYAHFYLYRPTWGRTQKNTWNSCLQPQELRTMYDAGAELEAVLWGIGWGKIR